VTDGESTDAEVTAALEDLSKFAGLYRLDGRFRECWSLRWTGIFPETTELIIRTRSWDRYLKVVKMALGCRRVVTLPARKVVQSVSRRTGVAARGRSR
jgi:hypothetical protein